MFGYRLIKESEYEEMCSEIMRLNMIAGIKELEIAELQLTYIQPRDPVTGRFVKRGES